MKKLSISLLAIMCAFVGTANAAAYNPGAGVGGGAGGSTGGSSDTPTITGWGSYTSVGDAWGGTASYTSKEYDTREMVETGFCKSDTNEKCKTKISQECDFTDSDGCVYSITEYTTLKEYQLTLATDTLFRQVLNELEKEAQGLYNAKLTEEQNMCRNANNGGILGRRDMTSTYRWVKLKKTKVPKSYATAGLTDKDITSSNDLYGSFCAARVTLQSDDTGIQEAIRNNADWASVYFAVGDVFTCGSWIPQSKLEAIAESVAKKKMAAQGKDDLITGAGTGKLTTNQKWWLAGATVLSAGAGGVAADMLQTKADGVNKFFGTNTLTDSKLETLTSAYNKASSFYASADGCKNSSKKTEGYAKMSDAEVIDGMVVYKSITKCEEAGCGINCEDFAKYKNDLNGKLDGANKSDSWWQRGGRRGTIDAVAGLGTGLLGFYATRETMKDANKKEYDAAEREAINEFMSNVGNHIFCFIGSEEAGTFGDIVEVSME